MPSYDVERIYCAEQISIPPELPEILKAYTKELIRQCPSDIIAFSREYFAKLSNIPANGADFLPPDPSIQQLWELREQLDRLSDPARLAPSGYGLLPIEQISQACDENGIPREMFQKVVRLGEFDGETDWSEFLVLTVTCLSQDFQGAVRYIFSSFSDEEGCIPKNNFLVLFGHIARRDRNLGDAFLVELENQIDADRISFDQLQKVPVFAALM
mmetsp:Transcript_30993/g.50145  ORF Transcript_30993/g.50145 Transcript_30993/m.50145 type:complete len:214 (-) Transcript_30993:473-1114(-)|eukprot:CAMPEP_0184343624 /NCGR_PEP_ID=MMETSP1089-20130417/12132_1 /TAXON_ID=38269 ORGANISM="Gloeochaete wittrockiana, Strain SAG46.84" /NCGR_SAMPLE_ID=MMETSP1089 /ASSEMBLY_ACC=CAM_ASM_000445 /LENGTH=213 /DNA_ID=CAMNT_0026673009 /DNA_START=36 /DNA_END=677 /DNA_ORIENTATION=-